MLISGASSFIMSFSTQLVKIILSEGKTPAVMFYAFAFQFNFSFTPPPRKLSLTRASAFIFYSVQVSYIHRRCSGLDRMPGDETPYSGDGVWHRCRSWLGVCVGIVLDFIFFFSSLHGWEGSFHPGWDAKCLSGSFNISIMPKTQKTELK